MFLYFFIFNVVFKSVGIFVIKEARKSILQLNRSRIIILPFLSFMVLLRLLLKIEIQSTLFKKISLFDGIILRTYRYRLGLLPLNILFRIENIILLDILFVVTQKASGRNKRHPR